LILVAGPPCGGKTTYVAENADKSDRIVDFDDIVESMTGSRYTRTPAVVEHARAEWRRQLPGADWVIFAAPRRSQRASFRREFDAEVIIVAAGMDECLRRAEVARPPEWQNLIRGWFADCDLGNDTVIDTGR
jgi:hypothetical protein